MTKLAEKLERARSKAERVQEKERAIERYAQRRAALELIREHTDTIEAVSGDLRFLIDAHDTSIGHGLFIKGRRPEFTVLARALDLLERFGRPAQPSVFIDVGANFGSATLAALKWHGFARAVACEPSPRSVELLKMNAIRNHVEDRLHVVPAAISDRTGHATLRVSPTKPGQNQLVEADADGSTLRVPTTTLDDALAALGIAPAEVGLLWIDAQAHEPQVARGAQKLLEQRPPIVFEYWPAELRRRGTLEAMREAFSGYERFVDLRAVTDDVTDVEALLTEIDAVTASLDAEPRETHTDLLAF
jgi:FkbM family methyltransferase